MIQIHEIIKNGAITTLKGILLRDKQVIHFLFNGNDHEFRIDAKVVVPEFGLFEINNFSVEEVDLTTEEVNEILRYLPRTEKANKTNKKIIGKIISPMGSTPLYEGESPLEVIQEIVKDLMDTQDSIIVEDDFESSLIESMTYNATTEILTIAFRTNGSVYMYKDVPKSVVEEFLSAESKGRYFNKNIKGNYDYMQVQ